MTSDSGEFDFRQEIAETEILFGMREVGVGVIVHALALIDSKLGALLESKLRRGKTTKSLLKHDEGPLGTYASRAKILYALGTIDKQLFNELQQLGEIRNRCAHTFEGRPFEDSKLQALMEKLEYPALVQRHIPPPDGVMTLPREIAKYQFIISAKSCVVMLDRIARGDAETQGEG